MFAALAIAMPAWALTEGGLRGTISDESGLPIPGVTVSLSSEALIGGVQEHQTDSNGAYQFNNLPPGDYDITATKAGFASVTAKAIQVVVNRSTTQNITMPITGVIEVVEVKGERRAVDVSDTSRGEVLTKEFLERIPTGRSYQSAVQLAAGVLPGSGGNPNMAGSATNENTYMLDGANITDPVTGTFSLNFNYDAIEQIEVVLGGYAPEYGVSLGGIINIVTETGTNNLEFDSGVYYENGNLRPRKDARYTADGWTLAPTDFDSNFQAIRITAKVSGPVVRDRAWFIFSYQATRTLIANTGILVPRDFDAHYVLSKLTVQPTSEHRFTAFLQLDPTSIDNLSQGSIFVKPEAQPRQVQGGYVSQLRWQWFLSPEATLDTMAVIQKTYIEISAVPCTHDRESGYHPCFADEAEGDVDWETPGRVGAFGAYDSVNWGTFDFDDRFRFQATSKLSLLGIDDPLGGTHDMKFGVEGIQTVWDRLVAYSGNTLYVDLNLSTFDPNTFLNWYWLETGGPIKFRTSGSQWNVFAQDSYKPIPNVTINYGMRYDSVVMRDDTGDPVITGGLLGPRLYAAWDPFGDQKTKIAGGVGRFNDTGRLGVPWFVSNNRLGVKYYRGEVYEGSAAEHGFLNSNQYMWDVSARENPNFANEKLRTPSVDEVSIILEREIIEDVALRINLTGKFTHNIYEYDNTTVIYDEDGSAVIGSRSGDVFTDIFRLRTPRLAERDYYQADFVLDKIFSRRWFARTTYTYSQSFGTSDGALSGSFANDPQTRYNYGPLIETDVRHAFVAYGAWDLPTDPWKQEIGFVIQYYSGNPLERRYYSDDTGGYSLRIRDRGLYVRYPSLWWVAIRFAQELDVRKGKLVLSIDVDNLFNNRAPFGVNRTVLYAENRLMASSRQDPLRLQFGVSYQF